MVSYWLISVDTLSPMDPTFHPGQVDWEDNNSTQPLEMCVFTFIPGLLLMLAQSKVNAEYNPRQELAFYLANQPRADLSYKNTAITHHTSLAGILFARSHSHTAAAASSIAEKPPQKRKHPPESVFVFIFKLSLYTGVLIALHPRAR